MAFEKELHYARRAAHLAAQNALRIQRAGVQAITKSDLSPVTQADQEGEQIIAGLLHEAFPGDGILGEEGASHEGTSGRRWIIDPIDGTRDFVRGNHLWCVLIGLEADGEVKTGVAHFPVLERTYFALRGGGAFRNDLPLQCSTRTAVADSVYLVNIGNKVAHRHDRDRWIDFLGRFWSFRCLGGALDAMMVAEGQAELWMEPAAQAWDFAPLQVITEEAGCRFFDLSGQRTIHGRSGVACAPGLEAEVRGFLATLDPVKKG